MRSRWDEESLAEQLAVIEDGLAAVRRAVVTAAAAIEQIALDLYEDDEQARLAACGQAEDMRAIAGWDGDW